MIISRTPFRISFFGGGTDYHEWYREHNGCVLSTTISHYVYVTCRYLPPFFTHKSRFVWRIIEELSNHENIENPIIRAALKYLDINNGIEIHYQGDLPSRSGIGSSSAFAVGILNALYALYEIHTTKRELACGAIHLERNILKEKVGVQDQIAAAYGGLNHIEIRNNDEYSVKPIILHQKRKKEFESHLMLFFTGISRFASDIAAHKIQNMESKKQNLIKIQQMVDEAIKILTSNENIKELGKLLDESWRMKRDISSKISTSEIDQIYDRAKKAGAIGGKLLGAGGGGFMLLFVEPDKQAKVLQELSNILYIPFAFENEGSKIIYYDQKYNSFVKNSFHGKSFEDHSDEFKKIINSKKQHIE